ncbi:MAG: TetR/AcrR family transcriptional regulator [Bdellovibrionota bacterium]
MIENLAHPRERLIQTAASLVHKQGWTSTGINQILSDAGIPKGSFYYYFRSKEALGVAILQRHYNETRDLFERTLANLSLSATEAIDRFQNETIETQRLAHFKLGCLTGNLVNEIANQSDILLQTAQQTLALHEDHWTAFISRSQSQHVLKEEVSPNEAARTVVMLLQGAFLLMKCTANSAPLELAFQTIRNIVNLDSRPSMNRLNDKSHLQVLAS